MAITAISESDVRFTEKIFFELIEVIHKIYGIDVLIVESDLRGIGILEKLETLYTQGEIDGSTALMNGLAALMKSVRGGGKSKYNKKETEK